MKKFLCLMSIALLTSFVAAPATADDEKKEGDKAKPRAEAARERVAKVLRARGDLLPGFASRIAGFGGVELTDEQKEKMKKIAKDYGDKIKELRESYKKADTDEAKKEARAKMQAASKEFRDARMSVLTVEQKKKQEEFLKKMRERQGQATWRFGAGGGFPGVELSDEQKKKMKEISADYMEKMKSVRESYKKADTDEDKREVRTEMATMSKEFRDARMGVLTEEQKKKYEEAVKKMRERFKGLPRRRIERKPAEKATPEI